MKMKREVQNLRTSWGIAIQTHRQMIKPIVTTAPALFNPTIIVIIMRMMIITITKPINL